MGICGGRDIPPWGKGEEEKSFPGGVGGNSLRKGERKENLVKRKKEGNLFTEERGTSERGGSSFLISR